MSQVVKQRQTVPHSRADVEVLPDMEEVQERMAMAMQAVDAYAGSSDAPLSAVMRAANDAATAAASASTLVRHLRTQPLEHPALARHSGCCFRLRFQILRTSCLRCMVTSDDEAQQT